MSAPVFKRRWVNFSPSPENQHPKPPKGTSEEGSGGFGCAILREREKTRFWPDAWPEGWRVIDSAILGERVLWARDGKVQPPPAVANLPRYDWLEVVELVRQGVDAKQIEAVHAAKTILGARVIVGEG